MIVGMRYIFVSFTFFLFFCSQVFAYELNITEIEKPYDVVPVTLDSEIQKVYLGVLDNFPVMYEVEVSATTTLTLGLRQKYYGDTEPVPFALMVVRKNDDGSGVTEVARFYPESGDWLRNKDSEIGITFLDSKTISNRIAPGTYNVEVSTPENIGNFSLIFGKSDEPVEYFKRLGQVRTTQRFFGYSILRMLTSSLVYYPIGIIFVLYLLGKIFKYKNCIKC